MARYLGTSLVSSDAARPRPSAGSPPRPTPPPEAAPAGSPTVESAGKKRRRWAALAVLLAGPFLAVLDGFVVVVALPSIQDRLHASNAGVQLVVAGYAVAYAALLVPGGRLGDLFGRRRLLLIGFALFSVASLIAASAPTEEALVLARCLQGGAAALMYPQALALIRLNFRGRDLAVAMAAFGVALGTAAVLAQLVSGALVQADLLGLGWRPIFAVQLPISAGAAALAVGLVSESSADGPRHLDMTGVALLTIALVGVVGPLVVGRELGWPVWSRAALVAGILVGGLFAAHERRVGSAMGKAPLVDLDLFRIPAFAIGLLLTVVFYGGQLSFWVLLTLYLQHGVGLGPLAAGLVLAPVAMGFLCAAVASQRLSARSQRGALGAGAILLATCDGLVSVVAVQAGGQAALAELEPFLFGCGLGFGLVIPTLVGTVLRAMPAACEASASGVLVTAQQVAGAVGVAVSGLLLFGLLQRSTGFPVSFAIASSFNVALFAMAGLLAYLFGRTR